MNILYLQDHGEIGGAQLSLLDLLDGFQKSDSQLQISVVVGKKGFLFDQLQQRGFWVKALPFPEYRKWKTVFQRHRFTNQLAEICQERQIQIIHANTHQMAPWATSVAKKLNLKSFCTVREIVARERLVKYRILKQDHIIAITNAVKESFPAAVQNRSSTIYNCIAPALPCSSRAELAASWKFSSHAKLAGCLGKVSERKGIATFLDAIPAVLRAVPDVHFLVIGGGASDYRSQMIAKTEELQITNKVTFCGELKNGAGYLHCLDIFVLPSFTEGLGRVTVEAMYAGLPVVATNTGGTVEVVEPDITGRLVPPKNPDALAREMIFYFQHETIRHQHGAAGKMRAEKLFDLSQNARKMERLYHQVAKNKFTEGNAQ